MANLSNINNKFLVTTGGEVLVGRTAATGTSKLQVTGSLLVGTDINSGIPFVVQETTADGFAIGFMRNTNSTAGNGLVIDVNSTGGNYIQDWRQAGNVKMRLLQNGNLGIGTDLPKTSLDIVKDADIWHLMVGGATKKLLVGGQAVSGDVVLQAGAASTPNNAAVTTAYNLCLQRDGGNVGIGATDPLRKLHVVGNMAVNAATTQYYGILMQGGEGANPSIMIGDWHNSSASIKWDSTGHYLRIDSQHSTANAAILFSGNDGTTEYMRIASTGNVGIGTTSPDLGAISGTRVLTIASPETERWGILELAGNRTWGGNQVGELKFISTDSTNNGTLVSLTAINDPTSTGTGGSLKFSTRPNGGSLTERMRIKADGNILVADTRRIQFYNTDQYIGATSTNDLEIGAGDDINYRSNFSRFFSGSAEHARLTGVGSASWVVNGSATHLFGVGLTNPSTKLTVKDSQDSSLYSGLKVERSANTTGVYLNAVGGALNLNTDASMPLKFRIQNSSMQTINTDGGRAYAGFGGWRMFEYSYTVSVGNGATVDLFQNTSAHSDLHMVQIAIRMFHSGRTYFVGSGTVGGYGMNIIGSGSGATNGGLTSALVSSGIRKLQITQSSGFTAQATIYIQFRLDSGSGINVLNGTLSSL